MGLTSTSKEIKGTNIVVKANRSRTTNSTVNLWISVPTIRPEDKASKDPSSVFFDSLRPEKKLIDPSEAFAQATKTLRPAVKFNTYDKKIAKKNRQAKRDLHAQATAKRREERMAPNPALRAALNPKKLPPASMITNEDQIEANELMDSARQERDDNSRKLGLRVKKLGKNKNRKDFRDPRERKTIVGDEL